MYPTRQSYISYQASLFYKEENVWVRDLELRKKVNQIKAAVPVWQFPKHPFIPCSVILYFVLGGQDVSPWNTMAQIPS